MRSFHEFTRTVAADGPAIERFVDSPHRRSGGLSDHLRLDLEAARRQSVGFVAVAATTPTEREIVGYAQLSAANEGHVMEVIADDDATEIDLFESALSAFVRHHAGTPVTWWSDDPSDQLRAAARSFGLEPHRALHEMRRQLPHPDRATIDTRSFKPGTDDAAWLAVNNRAFADHAEQGGWTLDALRRRVDEPWFDADGFRIHDDDDDRMIGFCWTKLHPATDDSPEIGEIYVIAVDPRAHGRGLGRELTLAGLDSISDRGVTVANLYVDAGNTVAVRLYEQLGFHVARTREAWHGVPSVVEADSIAD